MTLPNRHETLQLECSRHKCAFVILTKLFTLGEDIFIVIATDDTFITHHDSLLYYQDRNYLGGDVVSNTPP